MSKKVKITELFEKNKILNNCCICIAICVRTRYEIILKLYKNSMKQKYNGNNNNVLRENRTAVESKFSLIRKMYNWQTNLFTSFRKKNCIIKIMNRPESITRIAVASKRLHNGVSSLFINT